MKKILSASILATMAVVGVAQATNLDHVLNPLDHATRTEVRTADAKLQSQIDTNKNVQNGVNKDFQSQIDQKGYEINTQAKYTTSVNEDLQASKTAQAGVNSHVQGQISDVNNKVDSYAKQGVAAYNQVEGQISETNKAVSKVDAKVDKYAQQGADAYSELKGENAAQNEHINAVQDAAQQANIKGDNAAVRLDSAEGAIRETNAQLEVTDARSIKNSQDISTVNKDLQDSKTVQTDINGQVQNQISDVNGKAVNAQNTADVAVGLGQKGINDAYNAQKAAEHAEGTGQDAKNTAINAQATGDYAVGLGQKNANDIVNTNKTVAGNKAAQDVVNSNQTKTNTQVQGQIGAVDTKADTGIALGNKGIADAAKAQTSANQANTAIAATNKVVAGHETRITQTEKDVKATNSVVSGHTNQLANHETRLGTVEQVNDRQDATLNQYGKEIQDIDTGYRAYGARMDQFDSRLNKIDKKADRAAEGSAIALAVAGHQFNTEPDAGLQLALSASTTGDKQGIAFGAGGAINKNWFVNVGVGSSGNTTGGVISTTWTPGR